MKILKVFVGYDSREDIAWQVCRHAILRRSAGVTVHPLRIAALRELGLYTRGPDTAATEFSLTRFLTPFLAAQDGWSVFVDCDVLVTTDIRRVLDHADPRCAVHVVQHDYVPARSTKMDDQPQTTYPRKNWSSFILFNGSHLDVRALTPSVVNAATPAHLHRFGWVTDDAMIGPLPRGWNFLEGEYPAPLTLPEVIHFTNGGPWFEGLEEVGFADLWRAERDHYLATTR